LTQLNTNKYQIYILTYNIYQHGTPKKQFILYKINSVYQLFLENRDSYLKCDAW